MLFCSDFHSRIPVLLPRSLACASQRSLHFLMWSTYSENAPDNRKKNNIIAIVGLILYVAYVHSVEWSFCLLSCISPSSRLTDEVKKWAPGRSRNKKNDIPIGGVQQRWTESSFFSQNFQCWQKILRLAEHRKCEITLSQQHTAEQQQVSCNRENFAST